MDNERNLIKISLIAGTVLIILAIGMVLFPRVLGWLVILDILIILLVIGVVGLVVNRRPKWIWKRLDKNKDRRADSGIS